MRRLWDQVLVYLARLGAPGAVRRATVVVLVMLAAVVSVLGYWGWVVLERQEPGVELDFWTRLYRTQTLFTGEDGSLLKVPVQLDAARLLAPMVLLGFGALAVFNLASTKMQRFGARHATGHVLFIGQPARLDRLRRLLGNELPATVAVYAVPDASKVDSECLRCEVDLDEDEWPTKTSAKDAKSIVVAVQDDDRAVAIATLAAERFKDSQLVIDVGSADTMRWLGLWMMTRHHEQDIRVISIDQADARVQAQSSEATRFQVVVVAGAEAGSDRIVSELREQMFAWGAGGNENVRRPLLFIVDEKRPGVRSDANDAVEVEAGTENRAIEACGARTTRVLALGRSGMKAAMRVAAAVPQAEFVRLDADGFDGRQLVEEVIDGDIDEVLGGLLHGPLHLLTASAVPIEHPLERDRTAPAAVASVYSKRVADLAEAGFRICVEQGTPPYLASTILLEISRSLGFPTDDDYRTARALVHGMAVAGYRITVPERTAPDIRQPADIGSIAMDEMDELVESVAKFNHMMYLKKPAEPGNPSNVSWDDLPADLKQQNFRQVRHVIELLEAMGITIQRQSEPLSGHLVEELTEADWHEFGRREHDRWARNKVANGFVWGPERDPTGSAKPQPHPDLIDYTDLPDETKAKDYDPVVHSVEAFRSAGYVLVKRA